MRKRRELTPEEKAARAERRRKLVEDANKLKKDVEERKASAKGLEVFYEMAVRLEENGHTYSWNNLVLIYLQCPHASILHKLPGWKPLGYHVKKGEHGIEILAPHKDEQAEDKKAIKIGCHWIYVYDLSQVVPFEDKQREQSEPNDLEHQESETQA